MRDTWALVDVAAVVACSTAPSGWCSRVALQAMPIRTASAPVVHPDKRAATSFSHGHKKAMVAVAHAILVTAYHLLGRQTAPGGDYYDHRHAERVRHRAFKRWNAKATGSRTNPPPERRGVANG